MGDADGDGIEDEDEGEEVAESDACGAAVPLVTDSTDPHSCAPEGEHVMHLAYDTPEEMRDWPRRIRARRNAHPARGEHAVELYLYYPDNPEDLRQIHFTADMFQRWLDNRGETRNARAVATWGEKTPVEFKFSKFNEAGEFVFDPAATDARLSIDVYNLDASQPKWRRLLERSLAILPIQHVRDANLKSVFLDFRVGTSRIGTNVPVGDGGTNWKLRIRTRRGVETRTATRGIDPEGCSAVCATFASLNRAWGQRDVADADLPTESGIDTAFDDPAYVTFTFYHELGHLLDYGGHTRGARTAAGPLNASARNALWGRYRDAINYDGESDGAGEGFAEAYRQRMLGDAFAARHSRLDAATTSTTIREMNEAFDSLNMPSLAAVNRARAAIRTHFGGG
jgi:hypothetical protein